MKQNKNYRTILLLLLIPALLMAAGSTCCFLLIPQKAGRMLHQQEAERWRGGNEMAFTQVNCYLAADDELTVPDIYEFRYKMIEAMTAASVPAADLTTVFTDAWSTKSTVQVQGDKGKGTVTVTAVGGNFFEFHPVTLLYGTLLKPDDFMKDRVLLDRETAWLTFGGIELTGMTLYINNVPFVIGGIIEREQDPASAAAYQDGMGIYMAQEAYAALTEDSTIDAYEVVMPEPVEGFALNVVNESFPLKNGVAIDATNRYYIRHLFANLKDSSAFIVQNHAVRYPYWENAARITEAECTDLLRMGIVLGVYPLLLFLIAAVVAYMKAKDKITEEIAPGVSDSVEEFFRVRGKRRLDAKKARRR